MKKYSLVTFGENVADFILNNTEGKGVSIAQFNVKAGGAPGNVAVSFNKFKSKNESEPFFITNFGNDSFGEKIRKVISNYGVNIEKSTISGQTTLAFVNKVEVQGRLTNTYSFYNKTLNLNINQNIIDTIEEVKIFHFCSLTLAQPLSRQTTLKMIKVAQKSDTLISFDVNLREFFWDKPEEAKDLILKVLPECDIVKVNIEKLEYLTNSNLNNTSITVEESNELLKSKILELFSGRIKLIVLTKDSNGSSFLFKKNYASVPSIRVNSIDPTGAGDAFTGALLAKLISTGLENLEFNQVKDYIKFANVVGALTTTRLGAMESIPNINEI